MERIVGICYEDNEPPPSKPIKVNPNRAFIKHYENSLYLQFIADHTETSFQEKNRANYELTIADRKMAYWRKHPEFSEERMISDCLVAKSKWK